MKRAILALCALAIATISLFAQKGTSAYLDEKRSFKGFVLGDSINHYADKIKPLKNGWYEATDTTLLQIGDGIKLATIQIGEYNGLIRVVGGAAPKVYGNKIFDVFVAAYGTSFVRPNKFMDRYTWLSESHKVKLDYDNESRFCTFFFTDMDLDAMKGKGEWQKTKEAVDDL